MRSAIITSMPIPKERPFPKLMIYRDTIIMATDKGYDGFVGTVIYTGPRSCDKLGYHADTWNNSFKDFFGSISISED